MRAEKVRFRLDLLKINMQELFIFVLILPKDSEDKHTVLMETLDSF